VDPLIFEIKPEVHWLWHGGRQNTKSRCYIVNSCYCWH